MIKYRKRYRKCLCLLISAAMLIAFAGILHAAQSSAHYSIETEAVSSGGGEGNSTHYNLFSTIGQSSPIGNAFGFNHQNNSGFWHAMTGNPELLQYVLTVITIPHGGGIVTGDGISCPGTCYMSYDPGTDVTLTVTPNIDYYTFSHWTGCNSSSGTTCYVTMNAYKTVTANFLIKAVALGPDLTGQWTSLTNKCTDTDDGIRCKVRGKLKISNIGNLTAKSSKVRYFLSNDAVFDPGDTLLKKVATGKIKKGKSTTKTFSYTFPHGEAVSGKYILAVIDFDNTVVEIDETNNIAYGQIP